MFIDSLCVAFLALFAGAVGLFLGCGNYKGVKGAIAPGVITGVLIGIPAFQSGQSAVAAFCAVSAVIGSVLAACLPENNVIKHLSREQGSLVISAGSYQLGRRKRD